MATSENETQKESYAIGDEIELFDDYSGWLAGDVRRKNDYNMQIYFPSVDKKQWVASNQDKSKLRRKILVKGDISADMQSLQAEIIGPDHPEYRKRCLVWNLMIDCNPLAICLCETANHVCEVLEYVLEEDIRFVVRSGGHSISGKSVCDGIIVDLSPMNDVKVNPETRVAEVGGGCSWNKLDAHAAEHGLATVGGLISTTHVGGLTLGGGLGWLSRRFGAACDCVTALEIIVIDKHGKPKLLRASADENSDLFWALRGAGTCFGVVTKFEFELQSVDTVCYLQALFKLSNEKVNQYVEFTKNIREDCSIFGFIGGEQDAFIFEGVLNGQTDADCIDIIESLLPLEPLSMKVEPRKYCDIQKQYDIGNPPGYYYWTKSVFLEDLTPELVAIMLSKWSQRPKDAKNATIEIMQLGGKVSNTPKNFNAFVHRDAGFEVHCIFSWHSHPGSSNLEETRKWGRDFVESFPSLGSYQNFQTSFGEENSAEIGKESFGENYDRLRILKAKFDPLSKFPMI